MRRSRQKIQVVDVVPVGCDHRMIALGNQHQIAVSHRECFIELPVTRVHPLDCVAFGPIDPVVVEFFEVHLLRAGCAHRACGEDSWTSYRWAYKPPRSGADRREIRG